MNNQSTTDFSKTPILIKQSSRPRIPEGEYIAEYIGYKTSQHIDKHMLDMSFRIVDGEYNGSVLSLFVTVDKIVGKPMPNGEFIPKGSQSNLAGILHQAAEFMGMDMPISMSDLKSIFWKINVTFPKVNWKKQPKSESELYSKISEIYPHDWIRSRHDF